LTSQKKDKNLSLQENYYNDYNASEEAWNLCMKDEGIIYYDPDHKTICDDLQYEYNSGVPMIDNYGIIDNCLIDNCSSISDGKLLWDCQKKCLGLS
jgi:hypothetical protein